MKNKINVKSLVFGAVLGAVVMLSVGAVTPNVTKWEYKQSPTQVGDDQLNKWADEGWSVVCVGTSQSGAFYILKRPKQ